MNRYTIHLKNHDNSKFAVTEVVAEAKPSNDRELMAAVNQAKGALVHEYVGFTYELNDPHWVSPDEFATNWFGD